MELIENLTYNFCILKFKDTKPIPFIKVLEKFPNDPMVLFPRDIVFASYS